MRQSTEQGSLLRRPPEIEAFMCQCTGQSESMRMPGLQISPQTPEGKTQYAAFALSIGEEFFIAMAPNARSKLQVMILSY
jgi:hypothetical protein